MINSRKYGRAKYNVRINLRSLASGKEFKASIVNISEEGMCIRTIADVPLGDAFIMEFQFFSLKPLKVVGSIVWKKKDYLGDFYGIHLDRVGFFTKLRLKKGLSTHFVLTTR